MTILDDRRTTPGAKLVRDGVRAPFGAADARPAVTRVARPSRAPVARSAEGPGRRPVPARPSTAPLSYRSSGVPMSRAPHRPRPVSVRVTVVLACLTALITLWLGSLARFSGERAITAAPIPERLGVVQVQAGETLENLARRVAPEAPAAEVSARIRDLNNLQSASLDAGQTLIAPLG